MSILDLSDLKDTVVNPWSVKGLKGTFVNPWSVKGLKGTIVNPWSVKGLEDTIVNPWSVKGLEDTVVNPWSVRFEVYHCESLICQRFEGYRCESGLPLFKRKVTWNYINVVLTFNECKYGLIKFEPRVRKFVCKISLEGIVLCRRKFVIII